MRVGGVGGVKKDEEGGIGGTPRRKKRRRSFQIQSAHLSEFIGKELRDVLGGQVMCNRAKSCLCPVRGEQSPSSSLSAVQTLCKYNAVHEPCVMSQREGAHNPKSHRLLEKSKLSWWFISVCLLLVATRGLTRWAANCFSLSLITRREINTCLFIASFTSHQ